MNKISTLAVLGGDSRQIHMAEKLTQLGYGVTMIGFDLAELPAILPNSTLSEALPRTDGLILPLPVTRDQKNVNAVFAKKSISLQTVLQNIRHETPVFCGMPPLFLTRMLSAHKCPVSDYFNNEELTLRNAMLTAEGILSILLEALPITVFGLSCAVVGYGRVAKYTARYLHALGAQVTVFARSDEARALAQTDFLKTEPLHCLTEKIAQFDCVINTVPHPVITADAISRSADRCVFIEVASAPYGIDAQSATECGRLLIKAVSLPGKTAPKTAGEIIAETIHKTITEGLI